MAKLRADTSTHNDTADEQLIVSGSAVLVRYIRSAFSFISVKGVPSTNLEFNKSRALNYNDSCNGSKNRWTTRVGEVHCFPHPVFDCTQ